MRVKKTQVTGIKKTPKHNDLHIQWIFYRKSIIPWKEKLKM